MNKNFTGFQALKELHDSKNESWNQVEKNTCQSIKQAVQRYCDTHQCCGLKPEHVLDRATYVRLFDEQRVPSLRKLIEVAHEIEMNVELVARKLGNGNVARVVIFGGKFNKTALLDMAESLNTISYFHRNEKPITRYGARKLLQLRQPHTKICWSTLAGLFHACGYELDVRLAVAGGQQHEALLSRLNYPAR